MNMGERVWEDPDDAEAPGLEEPRWVQKRRLILKEGGSEAYLSVSGPLTRVKPSAFKTGSRFKITPVKPSKDSFKFRYSLDYVDIPPHLIIYILLERVVQYILFLIIYTLIVLIMIIVARSVQLDLMRISGLCQFYATRRRGYSSTQ